MKTKSLEEEIWEARKELRKIYNKYREALFNINLKIDRYLEQIQNNTKGGKNNGNNRDI